MEELERLVRRTTEGYKGGVARHNLFPLDCEISVPRDQGVNYGAIEAVVAGLSVHVDLTPWTMLPLLRGEYSLVDKYGIDPEPLFGFNTPGTAAELFRRTFHTDVDDGEARLRAVLTAMRHIEQQQLLGRGTRQKMGYVREITGKSLLNLSVDSFHADTFNLLSLLNHTIDLLQRQKNRLEPEHPKAAMTEAALREWGDLTAFFVLHRLYSDCARIIPHPSAFYKLFADAVVETIAMRHSAWPSLGTSSTLHFLRGKGIEFAFHRRDEQFIWLGDVYGDCTAKRVRSQVDDRIANIHWTVYSWLLDPYYRVIEVFFDGRQAIKCHVLPLRIHDRNVFMLDAIEVVPQLRERKGGMPNPDIDEQLFAQRYLLLEALFEVCGNLATRMGLEAIYVEKFSNAKWVREEIEKLPDDGYHITEVEKPFEFDIIAENIRYFTGAPPGTIREEIQARNPWLMHRQLKRDYKDVSVLRGLRSNWRLKIAGP